jgi:hypothetical protein
VLGAVVFGAALLVVVPAAMAGEYAAFAHCPTKTAGVETCLTSTTEGGEIKIGSTEVPIVAHQTLQGGFGEENEATGSEPFYGASGAETFPKTPQKVPGGLAGLVKCNLIENFFERVACELIFENGITGVNAVTELAAPPTSIFLSEGALLEELPFPPYPPALSLPIKVRLENIFLGSECYIGSSKEPIELSLTSGTTATGLKGKLGTLSSKGKGRILVVKNNELVGNQWTAPKATGCGIGGILDGIIDLKLGLPSKAGENKAILKNTVEQSSRGAVEESGE